MMKSPRKVAVLHNTDYDAELTEGTGVDISAVHASALAVVAGLREAGFESELVGVHGLELFDVVRQLQASKVDLVFNLCESMNGDSRNEPTATGVLDLFGIPYTGSDTLALGSCLHKNRAKAILHGCEVPTPRHLLLSTEADLASPVLRTLTYPWVLKLVHEDASVGIEADNVAKNVDDLIKRARYMMQEWKQPVLAEAYVAGREINVTLLGSDDDVEILPLHEIDFSSMPPERPRIVSYAAKWDEAHVDYVGTKPVPVRNLSPEATAAACAAAKAAYAALGLRDYGRVDLRLDAEDRPFVIDINPNCDISPDAGVARSAKVAGMSYSQLLARIVALAWKRQPQPVAKAQSAS